MKKMTLQDLKDLFMPQVVTPGDPNTKTKATKKGHVHKHNKSVGEKRHALYLEKLNK